MFKWHCDNLLSKSDENVSQDIRPTLHAKSKDYI